MFLNVHYSVEEDDPLSNPVGRLQERCTVRGLPRPEYNEYSSQGQPHKKNFVISCTLGEYKVLGEGSTKKLAKRRAAHKMLNLMSKGQPDDLDQNFVSQFGNMTDLPLEKLSDSDRKARDDFYREVRDRNTPAIRELKVSAG